MKGKDVRGQEGAVLCFGCWVLGEGRTVNKEQSMFTVLPVTMDFHRRATNGLQINP